MNLLNSPTPNPLPREGASFFLCVWGRGLSVIPLWHFVPPLPEGETPQTTLLFEREKEQKRLIFAFINTIIF